MVARILVLLGFALLFGLGAPAFAETPRAAAPAADAHIPELLQGLTETKAAVSRLQEQLDQQGPFFDNFSSDATTVLGAAFGLFGTLMAAFVAIFTYRSAAKAIVTAKNEARLAAKSETEAQIAPYKQKLEGWDRLEANMTDRLNEIERLHKEAADKIGQLNAMLHESLQEPKAQAAEPAPPQVADPAPPQAVEPAPPQAVEPAPPLPEPASDQAAEPPEPAKAPVPATPIPATPVSATPIPESKFEERYRQGLAAHDNGDYPAALYWYRLAEDLAPDMAARAGLLNAKAQTEWQAGELGAASSLWQRVLDSYDNLACQNPELVPHTAIALCSTGIAQSKRGQHEAASATYDLVIHRFANSSHPVLREQVAKALFNKGTEQGAKGQIQAAIKTYGKVGRSFGDAEEPALRELVAKARNSANELRGKA